VQPESLRKPESQQALRDLAPDLLVVVAYGLILPQAVLDIPTQGCWNVHACRAGVRGADPACHRGRRRRNRRVPDADGGRSGHRPGADVQGHPHRADETGGPHDRAFRALRCVLADGLGFAGRAGAGGASAPDEGATYARKLDKAEARLDWCRPAANCARKVRAFEPWPVAEAQVAGERLRIHGAVSSMPHTQPRRARCWRRRAGLDIACGEGVLRLRVIQRDGGKAITAADYLCAPRPRVAGALIRPCPLPALSRGWLPRACSMRWCGAAVR
jgi:methionyl-tRNA formyltransferase